MNEHDTSTHYIFWTVLFGLVLSLLWVLSPSVADAAEYEKIWTFDSDLEGWTTLGFPTFGWVFNGNPGGSVQAQCTSSGSGCSTGGAIYITDTWSNLLGIEEQETVEEFNLNDIGYDTRWSGSGDKQHGMLIGELPSEEIYCNLIPQHTHTNTSSWITETPTSTPEGCLDGHDKGYDVVTLVVFVDGVMTGFFGSVSNQIDSVGFKAEVASSTFDVWKLMPLVPHAFASTTCEFITSGATTTAECGDAEIKNKVQDLYNGIVLFLIIMSLSLVGFEFVNNKRKRFKD